MSATPTLWRGSVLADGLLYELGLVPRAVARRRIFELARLREAQSGLRVLASRDALLVLFALPTRLDCATAGGAPVVRRARAWTTCELSASALDELPAVGEHLVQLVAGRLRATPLAELVPDELASWLDLEDVVALDVAPLGTSPPAPRAVELQPVRALRDVLELPLAPSARDAAYALEAPRARTAMPRASALRVAGTVARAIASRLRAAAARVAAALALRARASGGADPARQVGPAADDTPARRWWQRARAAPGSDGTDDRRWWQRLGAELRAFAARTVLQTRLASFIGRQHARYLSRLLEMFDDNRLDDALRYAIPLGGDKGGALRPALSPPGPRDSLALQLARAAATPASAIALGDDLFDLLRRRYRAAFERLRDRGEIEKAAFVLAELLHADAEAVQFLEAHQRLRLAAELAEARHLPPGLVIRQWFLAGEPRRALAIARRTGEFADAVTRLAATHPELALQLRVLWAEQLARAGAYAAAVEVCWDVPNAALADWLDHAIAVGGPIGARMLVRKLARFPESFADSRARVLALLTGPDHEPLVCTAVAEELTRHRGSPRLAALARPVLRHLLDDQDARNQRDLARKLLDVAADPILRADVQAAWGIEARDGTGVAVSARALAQHGDAASASFLDRPITAKDQRSRLSVIEGDCAMRGLLLAVAAGDFLGTPPETNSTAARELEVAVQRAFARVTDQLAARVATLTGAVAALNASWCKEVVHPHRTMATLATTVGSTLIVANVGTNRAYLWRNGALTKLTRDDTLLEDVLEHRRLTGAPMTEADLAAFPHHGVLTRVVGAFPELELHVTELALRQGDVIVVCSEPIWSVLTEAGLHRALAADATPRRAAEHILRSALLAAQPRGAVVVASFHGPSLRPPQLEPVDFRLSQVAAEPAPGGPAPTSATLAPVTHRWPANARGSLHVRDACLLPDGKLLLALGEAGACVVARDGRVTARFAEPAHALVLSDHGDRAIAIAPRGEVTRLSKLDLVRRTAAPWCDVPLDSYAATYDGDTWFVGRGHTVYAVDPTGAAWEHRWKVDHRGGAALALARNATALTIWFGDQLWTYELPSLTLRSRVALALPPDVIVAGAVSPAGGFLGWVHPAEHEPSLHRLTPGRSSAIEGLVFELDPPEPEAAPLPPIDAAAVLASTARLRSPVISERWCAAQVAHQQQSVVFLYAAEQTTPRAILRFEGQGARAGVRFFGESALVFDSWGRLLVLALPTGEVVRQQLV